MFFVAIYCSFIFADYPPAQPNETISPGFGHFALVALAFVLYVISFILLLIEILLRKFVIEKHFPNLKMPFKFSINEKLNLFLYIVFNVIFILALVPLVFFLIV